MIRSAYARHSRATHRPDEFRVNLSSRSVRSPGLEPSSSEGGFLPRLCVRSLRGCPPGRDGFRIPMLHGAGLRQSTSTAGLHMYPSGGSDYRNALVDAPGSTLAAALDLSASTPDVMGRRMAGVPLRRTLISFVHFSRPAGSSRRTSSNDQPRIWVPGGLVS